MAVRSRSSCGRAPGRPRDDRDHSNWIDSLKPFHQLAGARAGLINQDFDRMFLDAIEHDPEKLAALTREDYIREAGSEGIELIMWLIMRGALGPRIRRVHETYHVPASNTAAGMALFENLSIRS
ncbi:hypothetical protein ACF1G5_32625 [Streptomyces coeruleorubidus]|uniref:DODA-type extradiol aromatic ring-opening family dioxygenase n=1 Tax=Streptomyces coeruleorubidus TaxID=116188 RepID=UPI0036FFF71D